jgi:hypothetical protein
MEANATERTNMDIGTLVDSALSPGYSLGTVTAISVDGRIRVEWDDRTNSSHSPDELRVV